MELSDYILGALPITILELVAALAGSYYLAKADHIKYTKYIVWLLWLTFAVEVIGSYAPIAYFTDFELFGSVKDTPFSKNFWLYNIFFLIHYGVYIYYFRALLKNNMWRVILMWALAIFEFSSICYLLFTDVFFLKFSPFTNFFGSLLLTFSIVLFYLELLKSELLLKLKYFMPFYISVGAIVFHLCVIPVDLFSQYFSRENEVFINLRVNVLLIANIFLYSVYTIGFIVCSKKKKYS